MKYEYQRIFIFMQLKKGNKLRLRNSNNTNKLRVRIIIFILPKYTPIIALIHDSYEIQTLTEISEVLMCLLYIYL